MVSVEAVIIRKDGTREDLGQVAYWNANPFKRWAWSLSKFVKSFKKRRNQHVS